MTDAIEEAHGDASWIGPPDPDLAEPRGHGYPVGGSKRSYADEVNAPLSRETLEALRAELQSEEYARFRSSRRGKRETQ